MNTNGNRDIVVYRGESKDYSSETAGIMKVFTPSIYRGVPLDSNTVKKVNEEILHNYRHFKDVLSVFRGIEDKEDHPNATPKNRIKRLAVMQHYGMKSPLLDVTVNKNVALYFACCGNFDKTGYVYSFIEKDLKGMETGTVRRRMEVIWGNAINLDSTNMVINRSYVIDYVNVFSTSFDNIRYKRQEGRFLLHHFKEEDGYLIPVLPDYKQWDDAIDSKDKITNLIMLALKHKITRVYLFPDTDTSIRLYIEYHHNSIRENVELFLEEDDFKLEGWEALVKLLSQTEDGYYLLKTDMNDYYTYLKKHIKGKNEINNILYNLRDVVEEYGCD